ncbi:GrpB family protein [Sansalvadorimonas sp. 2012CJ34-2]|uniref:GrpB family protein n=1 Tax=Parendozoicomonas callyspongiae TaxID=2942213 RepID=A0ABT0PG14_9GAMM|nr:GrpB family protein [Sansalvadorimonas sp. 2012CJ34-2]MCL6270300.1 GrpB family protein [Sansalvadorimonas sp. 2012CJ34-2]
MRIIEVVEYNPEWADLFQKEQTLIQNALTPLEAKVVHIGSTAVPGLAAKPVIDIMILLPEITEIDNYNEKLEQLGYEPKGEFGIPGRRFFMKGGDNRTHHIHAFTEGNPEAVRHLAFRDYLIAHPQVAAEYASLKLAVARSCDNDMAVYCDEKNDFIQHHEKLALKWFASKPSTNITS